MALARWLITGKTPGDREREQMQDQERERVRQLEELLREKGIEVPPALNGQNSSVKSNGAD